MESQITKNSNGITIQITDLEDKKDALLEAFQECSEGRCTCPTEEYKKVEKMEVEDADNTLQLSITAKDDQEIDTQEIEKCLAYTKKRVSE